MLAGTALSVKKVLPIINSHRSSPVSQQPVVQAPTHNVHQQSHSPSRSSSHSHSNSHSHSHSYNRSPSSAQKITIQKARPKNGNMWLVGTSSEADSDDLKAVLMNAQSEDVVELEAGTYIMSITDVLVPKIQIQGRENAVIEYVDTYGEVHFKDLVFRDLKLDFSKIKYSAKFSAYDAKMTFERVKAFGTARFFNLDFSGNMEFEARNSEFTGVAINLDSSSRAKISDCSFEKGYKLFRLDGTSELDIRNSRLSLFEGSAFDAESYSVKMTAENITVTNGTDGFSGKFKSGNAMVKNSTFKHLKYFQFKDADVSCYMCEKENIAR